MEMDSAASWTDLSTPQKFGETTVCDGDEVPETLEAQSAPGSSGMAATAPRMATASRSAAESNSGRTSDCSTATAQNVAGQGQRITRQHEVDNSPVQLAESGIGRQNFQQLPAARAPEAAGTVFSASALKDCLVAMFLTAEKGPVASTYSAAAASATINLCVSLDLVVKDLWSSHAAEIKRRCAPSMPQGLIDRQELFGFALADRLGRPLLPPEDARGVGQRGDNAVASAMGSGLGARRRAGKLEKAKSQARESLRAARAAAAKDGALASRVSEAEMAEESLVAAVLATPVDLNIPNATVGSKRKRVAAQAA